MRYSNPMDWIVVALNETLGVYSPPSSGAKQSSNSDTDEGDYLNPPNFDHLLSHGQQQQQQQQGESAHPSQRRRHSFHSFAESTATNKSDDGGVIGIGNKVRIHPTEMQIYLRGLMESSSSSSDEQAIKNKGIITKRLSTLPDGGDDNNEDRPSDSNEGPLRSTDDSATGPPAPSASPASTDPSSKKSNRQKNDKGVEVYKDSTLIARFRTQTECARYLRATPEAVSYHCSKGGGVCNGLLVRPFASSSSANAVAGNSENDEDENYIGLFEGSTTHRPSARPQLSPEVVSLLKGWLLSPAHIDNPYPNGREYEMLMEMTKLDKVQLKHWFNNARKRILKPLMKDKNARAAALAEMGNGIMTMSRRKRKSSADDSSSDGSDAHASTTRAKAERAMDADLLRVDNSSALSLESRGTQKMTSNLSGLSQNQRIASMTDQLGGPAGASLLFQQGNNGYDGISGQNFNAMMGGRFDQLMGFNNNGASNMLYNTTGNAGYNNMMGYGDIMGAGGFASVNRATGLQGMDSMMMDSSAVNPPLWGYNQGMGEMFGRGRGLGGGGQASFLGGGMDVANNANPDVCASHPPSKLNDSFSDAAAGAASSTSEDVMRTNAVFKQQVAAMAMNEATVAFKEMEEAFALSKAIAQGHKRRRDEGDDGPAEDDEALRLLEADAHAKKCQSFAMFKLKVSQRASEEAATAYNEYERLRADGRGRHPFG
ncbi:hypothetical protein ACHAW5_004928 [Stephanodiscus triporus]|uniref:Homeobox domain-containing protein n=1 Tax=Stephanodiscus triporus TaxID=2934178 RepID=A0ABD3N7U2_9STRA